MSHGSPQRKCSSQREIPGQRVINDPSQLPSDYSSTPGGTIFSTTPGGTRIIYDRAFLMQMRNSPVARTPPKNLPVIPGVTSPIQKPRENGVMNGPNDKRGRRVKLADVPDDPEFKKTADNYINAVKSYATKPSSSKRKRAIEVYNVLSLVFSSGNDDSSDGKDDYKKNLEADLG